MRVSQVYTAAPSEERCAVEMETFALLDRLGIPYTWVAHDMANTIEDCAAVDAALGISICKNLFLCNRQETTFYLLMIPGDKKFKTKDLSAQIHSSRLSFAKETYMEELLDITPGSVSVLGLMNDREHRVRLLVDRDVLEGDYIGCHPCINTSSLRIRQKDMWEKIVPALEHEPVFVTLEEPQE